MTTSATLPTAASPVVGNQENGSIELRRVRKTYGDVTAVDDLDLTVQPGEFVTLLGPSGSGKTTTMMMVAGFEELTSGMVLINGEPVDKLPPKDRNLGVVFQSYALFPHMSARENVEFALRMRKVRPAERRQRAEEALERVGLAKLGDRRPRQLSGGQQQRVAMARAVVYRPDVLLLDEPLSNLDVKLRVAMRAELKRLQQAVGITTIFVTHDQHEALALSDRIGVMRDGRMDQVGTPQEIYDAPQSVFVADFVGGTNLLQGVVRQADTTAAGVTIEVEGRGIVMLNVTRPLKTGQRVTIAAKPERVALEQMPAVTDGLRGTIESAAYLGAGYSYVIAVGTQKLEARRPTPLSIDGYPAAPGETVLVTLDAESTQVFDA
jgi:putative spermidine/putrescine transport system ATP-binding protein